MSKNPLYNALAAAGYIAAAVGLMNLVTLTFFDSGYFMVPIIMLSLLTLSVAVMGYIFFYQPVLLILDGKRDEGVMLFLKTAGILAGIILLLIVLMYPINFLF